MKNCFQNLKSKLLSLFFIGSVGGFLSGVLGIGGGVVFVPLLTYFTDQDFKVNTGISSMAVVFVATTSSITYISNGQTFSIYIIYLILGGIIGGYLGSKLTFSLDTKTLQKIFALLLLLVSYRMMFSNGFSSRFEENIFLKKEFNEFPKFIYENYEKFSNNSSRYDSPDLLNEVRLNKTFKWDIKKIERLTKEKLKNNKKVYNFYLKKGFEYILNESGGFDASFLITIVEFSKNLNEYGNQKIIKILNPLTKVEKLKFEKQLKQRFNKY